MLDFHQHIGCTTKGIDTLGHCYTPFKNGYRAKVLHTFRKSNHLSEVKTVDILIFWCPHHRKPDLGTVYWLERWEMQGRDCFTSDAWGNSCYPLKYWGFSIPASLKMSWQWTSLPGTKHHQTGLQGLQWVVYSAEHTIGGALAFPKDIYTSAC